MSDSEKESNETNNREGSVHSTRSIMSRIVSLLSLMVIVVMALGTLSTFVAHRWLHQTITVPQDYVINVVKGDTLSKVAYRLQEEQVLSSPRWLILYAQLMDKTHIRVGEYRVRPHTTHQQLLELLQSGDVISYQITLVEGKTFAAFIDKLHANPKIKHTLNDANGSSIIEHLGLSIEHPEGWFFPDTYQFPSGTTDKQLLLWAHKKMQQVLEQEWELRSKDVPYNNAYEALIMASIIEKETGVASERSEIAGVFVRRLQKGMRLQTDPTIIYGLGDEYKGNIRRKHLTQKTPYNTYVIDGLPPTPIAMPGREAIHAALHPKNGQSLYFVAKGDGSHYFSSTLAEHNRAVRKYQIEKRKKNYQSSPQQ